ncbi:MAG: hypothetical protein ACOYER_10100, partial [Limnochordia bacterium]
MIVTSRLDSFLISSMVGSSCGILRKGLRRSYSSSPAKFLPNGYTIFSYVREWALIVTAKRRIKGVYTKWLMKTGALKQGFRKKEAVELPAKRENVYARHRKKPPERPVAG